MVLYEICAELNLYVHAMCKTNVISAFASCMNCTSVTAKLQSQH